MNEAHPPRRLVSLQPSSKRFVIFDRCTHPAKVVHATLSGEMREFDVVIESVFNREEDGETRLAFRGKATAGDWSGYKTFFADSCKSLVDCATGQAVQDVPSWLLGLNNEPTPMTLIALTNAVIAFLENDLGISIGNAGAVVSEKGTMMTLTQITNRIGDPKATPYERLIFRLNGVQISSANGELGRDPITIAVYRNDDEPIVEQTSELVTSTKTPLPIAALKCMPCAGGRIEVRDSRG